MDIQIDGDILSFRLSGDSHLDFNLSPDESLTFDVSTPTHVETDIYTGQTEVNPDFVGVTLETARKLLTDDIIVKPIQVESVSNLSGGRTVYIGGI